MTASSRILFNIIRFIDWFVHCCFFLLENISPSRSIKLSGHSHWTVWVLFVTGTSLCFPVTVTFVLKRLWRKNYHYLFLRHNSVAVWIRTPELPPFHQRIMVRWNRCYINVGVIIDSVYHVYHNNLQTCNFTTITCNIQLCISWIYTIIDLTSHECWWFSRVYTTVIMHIMYIS